MPQSDTRKQAEVSRFAFDSIKPPRTPVRPTLRTSVRLVQVRIHMILVLLINLYLGLLCERQIRFRSATRYWGMP